MAGGAWWCALGAVGVRARPHSLLRHACRADHDPALGASGWGSGNPDVGVQRVRRGWFGPAMSYLYFLAGGHICRAPENRWRVKLRRSHRHYDENLCHNHRCGLWPADAGTYLAGFRGTAPGDGALVHSRHVDPACPVSLGGAIANALVARVTFEKKPFCLTSIPLSTKMAHHEQPSLSFRRCIAATDSSTGTLVIFAFLIPGSIGPLFIRSASAQTKFVTPPAGYTRIQLKHGGQFLDAAYCGRPSPSIQVQPMRVVPVNNGQWFLPAEDTTGFS